MNILPSLVNPPETQQDLPLVGASFFDSDTSEFVTGQVKASGDHTAAHLFFENPQLYKAIMYMYASGSAGQLKIASVLKVSVHTVRAVIQREKLSRGAAIDTVKTLESLSDLRTMTLETLIEKLSDEKERAKIPFDKLMIGLGIQTEKIELLRGNATERIEHVAAAPAGEEFEEWLKAGSIAVESTETGLPERESGTKGDRDPAGTLAPAPADPGACAPGPLPVARQIGAGESTSNNMDNVGIDATKPNESSSLESSDVIRDVILNGPEAVLGGSDAGEIAPDRVGEPARNVGSDTGGEGVTISGPSQCGGMHDE